MGHRRDGESECGPLTGPGVLLARRIKRMALLDPVVGKVGVGDGRSEWADHNEPREALA
jgi:hypothetical protein